MNRLKSESRIPASIYVALIAAAILAAIGGVLHAIYKNRQVQVTRDIAAVEQSIERHKLEISNTRMRSEQMLNRFAIRKQLEDTGSLLRPIPVGVPEDVHPTPPTAVASATP